MALMQNKNVLRVTGRSLSELGFDIRNLEMYQYRSEDELFKVIITYCETFFGIRSVPISKDRGLPYFEERVPTELNALGGRFCYQI